MSTQSPKGNPPTASGFAYITPSALEKRIRRHLSKDGLQLRKNRPGTYQFIEHGLWSVIDPRTNGLIDRRKSLLELAEQYGLLANHEILDTPTPPGWVWQAVRQSVVIEGGQRILHHEPISEIFKNQEEALQAAAVIGGDGVAVVGFYAVEDRS